MKSSPGFRIAVVTTLCVQPFLACTNDAVDFSLPGAAGRASLAGSGGLGAGVAGNAEAGVGAGVGDGGAAGSAGEGEEAGAAGSDAAGNGGAGNAEGGNAGRSGGGGRGGAGGMAGGMSGGAAGRAGGAGAGGVAAAGASGAAGAGGRAGAGGGGGAGGTAGAGGGAGTSGTSAGGASGAGAAGTGGFGASGGGAGGTAPVCGNAALEKGEQCDDGNTKGLDACSATCTFEQSQRANLIEQKFKTSTFCPRNAFGGAFTGASAGVAQTALQTTLDQRVANGSLSLLFAFRGLKDLSGMSTETITLGMAYGAPTPPVPSSYDGKSDLDWWYTPASGQIDSGGDLYSSSTGSLSNGVLDASADSLRIPLLSDLPIYVSNVKVRLPLGDSSAPLASTGVAPGHLPGEHVRAGLVSFASASSPPPITSESVQLCGALSTASLAGIAIPARYATGGASACKEGYAASRTFLDLLVGGCTVQSSELIAATQPDQSDPGAPAGGDGAPYQLLANASTHAVTSCQDKKGASVTLSTCLNAAAYSSAYRLKTGRVIIK